MTVKNKGKTTRKPSSKAKPGFQPGQSGNPNGRPKGSKNKSTLALQKLLDGEGEVILRKAIELAKAGNRHALKLCLERLLPPRKDLPVELALPNIEGPQDLIKALSAVLAAVSGGELTPGEALPLGQLLEAMRRSIEVNNLDERLEQLEARLSLEGATWTEKPKS